MRKHNNSHNIHNGGKNDKSSTCPYTLETPGFLLWIRAQEPVKLVYLKFLPISISKVSLHISPRHRCGVRKGKKEGENRDILP
jgi:hypothetical protein